MRPLYLCTLLILSSLTATAQFGSLNTTFGDAGYVRYVLPDEEFEVTTLAVQPDGGILMGGQVFGAMTIRSFVMRFLPGGALDPAFGTGGVVQVPENNLSRSLNTLAVQADGKLVLAGSQGDNNASVAQDCWFMRLNANGSVDASFGQNGSRVVSLGATSDLVNSIAIGADGYINAVAPRTVQGGQRVCFIRLTPSGALDTGFNSGGTFCEMAGTGNTHSAMGLVLRADGSMLVALQTTGFHVAAVRTDGTLDPAFGNNGLATVPMIGAGGIFRSIDQLPDGRIVVMGYRPSAPYEFHITRLLANGSPDTGFSANGTRDFTDEYMDVGFAVAPLAVFADGSMAMARRAKTPQVFQWNTHIHWLDVNGAEAQAGMGIYNVGGHEMDNEWVTTTALTPQGDLLVAVKSRTPVHVFETVLMKFNGVNPTTLAVATHAPEALRIHPVPAAERLHISHTAALTRNVFTLRDISGKVLPASLMVNGNEATLDVSGMAPGIYFIEILAEGQRSVRRFQVAR